MQEQTELVLQPALLLTAMEDADKCGTHATIYATANSYRWYASAHAHTVHVVVIACNLLTKTTLSI